MNTNDDHNLIIRKARLATGTYRSIPDSWIAATWAIGEGNRTRTTGPPPGCFISDRHDYREEA